MISDLLTEVVETLSRTTRVRVFGSTGPGEPTRKRRHRPPVLADQHDPEALMQLRAALALRPDSEVMDWMQWPDLWLELLGHDQARLTTLGLLRPGWLRLQNDGDLELQNPAAIEQWLTLWAPTAAATIAE
ncbi:hypothetical protein MRQ36_27665 [Micromonospora sp. R77]|uniref:hypothetical protein n=1 Tax=Micromonospora sp. R77 TaxID=2925836 RepID=UPI001F600BDE|nr:hypothetical protein [Micromonospora sp. R77]MCI4066121.1 hypothetical protein [Micromonospora sp. R77]